MAAAFIAQINSPILILAACAPELAALRIPRGPRRRQRPTRANKVAAKKSRYLDLMNFPMFDLPGLLLPLFFRGSSDQFFGSRLRDGELEQQLQRELNLARVVIVVQRRDGSKFVGR